MSKLYITEYESLPNIGTQGAQLAAEPATAVQVLDFSGGVQLSSAFSAKTRYVRLHTDAICSIRFDGSNATTSYPRMAADNTEYFAVQPGSKVSVIANT